MDVIDFGSVRFIMIPFRTAVKVLVQRSKELLPRRECITRSADNKNYIEPRRLGI